MRCPLCGHRFVPDPTACATCPFGKGCEKVCCPNCHYSFPAESKIVRWFRRRWKPAVLENEKEQKP